MTITTHTAIRSAVHRALELDPDLDAAIESVAQAMHLSVEDVREIFEAELMA